MTQDEDTKKLVRESMHRLYNWVKTTDLELPAQVSYDLGVVMGRLQTLEKRNELLSRH